MKIIKETSVASKLSVTKEVLILSRCSWTLFNFRLNLMQALREKGFRVSCAGAIGGGYEVYDDLLCKEGFPVIDLPIDKNSMNPFKDLMLFFSMLVLFARKKPDVIHLFTIKPVIYGALALRLVSRARIIATITGLGHAFTTGNPVLRKVVELLYKMALGCCDVVFFQNSDDRNLFIELGLVKAEKVRLIAGSGVDLEHFSPIDKTSIEQHTCFLMIGRLLKEKGIYEFVEAAKLLKSIYPHLSFEILGERDTRNPSVVPEEIINQWRDEGVVTWHGAVVDVRPYIERSDVVVLPSYREGIPRALLEAGAMAKPLITTDAPGCKDLVLEGENGFLAPVGSSKKLANAMEKFVLDNDLITSMGAQARRFVCDNFDEKNVIMQTIEQY